MKRIAALAALVITLLAVPAATAMAGTSGSGSGYRQPPRLVQVACLRPYQLRKGHFTFKAYHKAYLKAYLRLRQLRLGGETGGTRQVRSG